MSSVSRWFHKECSNAHLSDVIEWCHPDISTYCALATYLIYRPARGRPLSGLHCRGSRELVPGRRDIIEAIERQDIGSEYLWVEQLGSRNFRSREACKDRQTRQLGSILKGPKKLQMRSHLGDNSVQINKPSTPRQRFGPADPKACTGLGRCSAMPIKYNS